LKNAWLEKHCRKKADRSVQACSKENVMGLPGSEYAVPMGLPERVRLSAEDMQRCVLIMSLLFALP
jgi:hypothetical protein